MLTCIMKAEETISQSCDFNHWNWNNWAFLFVFPPVSVYIDTAASWTNMYWISFPANALHCLHGNNVPFLVQFQAFLTQNTAAVLLGLQNTSISASWNQPHVILRTPCGGLVSLGRLAIRIAVYLSKFNIIGKQEKMLKRSCNKIDHITYLIVLQCVHHDPIPLRMYIWIIFRLQTSSENWHTLHGEQELDHYT